MIGNINNDILACKDLFVVLSNNSGDYDYIESYRLTNVFYFNEKFWGKFSNVHSACGHADIDQRHILSYAYNNFSNVVCTSTLLDRAKRFYSAHTYATMEFNVKGDFQQVWSGEGGGDIEVLYEAVRLSKRLKLKVESAEGRNYILPLHTVEVDKTARVFYAETEYDGYPEEIRDFSATYDIEDLFEKAVNESGVSCPSTNYCKNSNFFLTSFKVYKDRIIHRYFDGNNNICERAYLAKNVSIWQEI